MTWPQARCDELVTLQRLLREASALNNSSDFLGRADRVIELARQLTDSDYADRGRPSFMQFLIEQATKEQA